MRTALLLLLALAAPAFASQTVWKWVDDKGVTHYSDRPVPGATRIELKSVSRPTGTSDSTLSSGSSTTQKATEPSGTAYRTLEISSPRNGDSVVNTGGVVTVDLSVDPSLHSGHTLRLYLDGALVEGPQNTTSHELKEVPRGMHSLVAVIHDRKGVRVQESERVVFQVRQESVAKPPVGPALRPPPKPRPGNTANKLRTTQPTYAELNGGRPVIDPRTNKPVVPKPKPSTGPK